MPWSLAALLAASYAISRAACAIVRRLALRKRFLDLPGGRKVHGEPIPLGGGISLWIAILAAVFLGLGSARFFPDLAARIFPPAEAQLLAALASGAAARLPALALLLACAGAVWLAGLVDDARGLTPGPKLAVEALAASALYLFFGPDPFRITLFTPVPFLWFLLTVVWIVTVTNAFNFIDNMDGLCAATGLSTSLLFMVLGLQTGQLLVAALFAALAGALLGFLPMNWPPARLFLGDAGSLLVGFLTASLTVLFTFYESRESPWVLAAPFLVLAVPLFDMTTVLWIRWRSGAPLTVGDRNHFSHRLLALGLSPRQVLGVVSALTLAIGTTATLLYVLPPVASALALLQAAGILAVVWLLERAGRRRAPPDHPPR